MDKQKFLIDIEKVLEKILDSYCLSVETDICEECEGYVNEINRILWKCKSN